MAYRLPGGRVDLAVKDDPYTGLRVEVEPITSWAVFRYALQLLSEFFAADGPKAEIVALRALFGAFMDEAQPTWEILDHRGPVPATANGMLRLPLPLGLGLIDLWTETFVGAAAEDAPATAVDEVYPPGPLRDQLNEVLARKRAEAEAA